ncbi:MAG: Wzz/FepE/Etk N-terminal domain-containing protein [Geminicoccaceae bacterium]|nr:Wzz/FepE/Etk N-terminal domain-containing protein [Geminicoccaceae bacterium]
MPSTLEQLLAFARFLWRHRWSFLGLTATCLLVGAVAVTLWPSRYEATARVYADTDRMLGPLLKGLTVETDLSRQLDVFQRTLLSRPNLEKVLESSGLAHRAPDPLARERAIGALKNAIKVSSQGWNLFAVSYRDRDPETARRVVQALLDIFVATNLGVSREDMLAAQRFIDEQIAVQSRALDEAERRLAEFQKTQAPDLPGGQGYFAALQELRRQIADIQRELDAARAEKQALERQLRNVPALVSAPRAAIGAGSEPGVAEELAALRRRLLELQARYTERHPDVVATKEAIAALEARSGRGGERGGAVAVSNPVYEQIRVRIAQKEAEIAQHVVRLARAEEQLAGLEARGRTIPEIEAELKRLTRDYEVIKRNYEELLARREAARIAGEVDARQERVAFRVVEPPVLPVLPASPPRLLLLAGLLPAASGFAAAVLFARRLVRGTFESLAELQRSYPLRVLGAVSEVARPGRGPRRERWTFTAAFGLLVAFVAALAVAERLQLVEPVRGLVLERLWGEKA